MQSAVSLPRERMIFSGAEPRNVWSQPMEKSACAKGIGSLEGSAEICQLTSASWLTKKKNADTAML